jgi:hypothetical protein
MFNSAGQASCAVACLRSDDRFGVFLIAIDLTAEELAGYLSYPPINASAA